MALINADSAEAARRGILVVVPVLAGVRDLVENRPWPGDFTEPALDLLLPVDRAHPPVVHGEGADERPALRLQTAALAAPDSLLDVQDDLHGRGAGQERHRQF